jgi:hypothetical protein
MKHFLRTFCLLLSLPPALCHGSTPGWTQLPDFGGDARHRAVAIAIGNRGYVGLGHINAVTDILYDDWWEFDPGTNSWSQKASFPGGARMHCSAFSIGSKGYVGFGRDGTPASHNDLYEYDPVTNTWTQRASLPGGIRRGAVGLTIGTKGYVCTGYDGSNYLKDLWEYDPVLNNWTQKANFPGVRRTSAAGFTIGNKAYVGTGDNGGPQSDFYEYDPATNSWTQKASVPPVPRMEACGFSLGGYGYLGTGCDQQSGNSYSDIWKFDAGSNTWTPVQDFAGAARRYMSSFTIGARAYTLFGTNGINYKDVWEYGNLTGEEEDPLTLFTVQVYPQPASSASTFFVSGPPGDHHPLELTLYDLAGKKVGSEQLETNTPFLLDLCNLVSGTYIYVVTRAGHGTAANGKLIKP